MGAEVWIPAEEKPTALGVSRDHWQGERENPSPTVLTEREKGPMPGRAQEQRDGDAHAHKFWGFG